MIINARFLTQQISGVQRYAIELSRELIKLKHDIIFVAPHNIIFKKIAKEFNVKIIGKRTGYYWEQIELPSYLKKNHKDDLLINLANIAPINYKNKIVTIHDVAPLRSPRWFSKSFSLTYKFLLPLIVRSSLKVITDSEFSKNEINLLLKVHNRKISVIPLGVFQEVSLENFNEKIISHPYILTVSSPSPRKNFIRLIEAFLSNNIDDIKLVIVGAENKILSIPNLNTEIESNPNIIFKGFVNDKQLVNLYLNAELFVYPSLYEGFGLPPLEAMACGCPCAVSKITSLPEVCGNAVVYFDPYNTQDIASTLVKLLNNQDKRNELIKKGFERIKNFTWEKSAHNYMKLIKELRS